MSKLLAATLLALGTTAAFADTAIYDTFNEGDQANLFDCCNVVPVDGANAVEPQSVAVPFVPEVFAKIRELDVALSAFDGNQMIVSITGSSMGLPGRVKKSFPRAAPAGGQCCAYIAMLPAQAVHAEAGGQYWIVVEGKKAAKGGWNLNSAGLSGPYAVKGADGVWTMTEGPLPAVRVISK
jgi:hypothetical protein